MLKHNLRKAPSCGVMLKHNLRKAPSCGVMLKHNLRTATSCGVMVRSADAYPTSRHAGVYTSSANGSRRARDISAVACSSPRNCC